MKTISAALQTHLEGDELTLCTVWKVTRRDGTVLAFTDHDLDLEIDLDGLGPLTYEAATGYNRSALRGSDDLRVDQVDITGLLDSLQITHEDLRNDLYRGAEVRIADINWADLTQGPKKEMRGFLGSVRLERNLYIAQFRALTSLLGQAIGELYTPDCRADLGDSRCTVDMGPWTHALTVATVISQRQFTVAEDISALVPLPAEGSPYFAGGRVNWSTGHNAGVSMEIKDTDVATGTVSLFLPMRAAVQVGDTLDAMAGCDKLRETCVGKFVNVDNMRAEPWVPGLDQALLYPDVAEG